MTGLGKKVCPKCQTEMIVSEIKAVIPAQQDTRRSDKLDAISVRSGVPVLPYHCPNCSYLELYYSPAI